MLAQAINLQIPAKLIPTFAAPRGSVRYRASYGGRGGGRSFNFALLALLMGAKEKLRILCCRQFQNSIAESFYAELKAALERNEWLQPYYDMGRDYLRSVTGSEFIFKGLERNIGSIKSISGVDICIVEEAEDTKETSWVALEPTIRKPKSEIWALWNPAFDDSPVNIRFRKDTPQRAIVTELCYRDNPFFPQELEDLRLRDKRLLSPQMYDHVWEGAYLSGDMGEVFKWSWFKTHMYGDHYGFDQIVHSWDTAYGKDEHGDPSACTVWGIKRNEAFLIDVINEHLDYPALKKKVVELAEKYPPRVILIEDKASGQSLLQDLRAHTVLPVIAIEIPAKYNKIARANDCTGVIEAGRIYVPEKNAEWLHDYKRQLVRFSNNPELQKKQHDDMVDSTSQFINWWRTGDNVINYEAIYGY